MKYFFSLLLSFAIVSIATAQDFKKVETAVLLNKFEDAKTEIDKSLADPKNQSKPEGYYWKSRIYAALFKNEATRAKYPNAVEDAHAAFQKYAELEPSLAKAKEKGPDGYFDMYATSFNLGINSFKDKKYDVASKEFEKAVVYSDYIFKNKWASSQQPFDTTSILYCAYSFQNAQKQDDAVKYYIRLAESKVTGEGFADIYKYLIDFNTKKKDKEGFEKYLALGKEVYPAENWEDFEIDYIDQNYDLAEKLVLYNEMESNGLMTEKMYTLFGDVFINAKNNDALDSAGIEKYTLKAIAAFRKAYEMNNNNAIAAFNVGVTYYNFFNLEDEKYATNIKKLQELNLNKPVIKDLKKKAVADADHKAKTDEIKNENVSIEKKAMTYTDLSSLWLFKSFEALKEKEKRTNTEKSVLNKSVDFLANICYYKMGRFRGKDTKQFELYESLYKEFDNLHGLADKGSLISKKISFPDIADNFDFVTTNSSNVSDNTNINRKGIIKVEAVGGVYMVPCKVNGLSLKFVFDTGASDVSISQTEASFMLKNGYLKASDITGKQNFMTADGSISEGVTIILRELEIGGVKLTNVKASVVLQSKAPLLLGQSALSRFGKFTFDNKTSTLILGN